MTRCVNCERQLANGHRFRVTFDEWGDIGYRLRGPICRDCWDAAVGALEDRARDTADIEVTAE